MTTNEEKKENKKRRNTNEFLFLMTRCDRPGSYAGERCLGLRARYEQRNGRISAKDYMPFLCLSNVAIAAHRAWTHAHRDRIG